VSVLLVVSVMSGLVGFFIGMETHRRISESVIKEHAAQVAALKDCLAEAMAAADTAFVNSRNILDARKESERSGATMWRPARGQDKEKPS